MVLTIYFYVCHKVNTCNTILPCVRSVMDQNDTQLTSRE